MWSTLTRRPRRLYDLATVERGANVLDRCYAGGRTVPLDQIRGSEGRAGDFDRDFHPLRTHTRERWVGIAEARRQGKELPPVSLVQVGGVYFVRDGHHRVSVASAFGQRTVEARVSTWHVEGPLPWQKPAGAQARLSGNQSTGEKLGRLLEKLQARLLPGIQDRGLQLETA
jgi:hypothetical protein